MINELIGRMKIAGKKISRTPYDALDLLASDHMKAEAALVHLRLVKNSQKRKKLFKQIRDDLEKHMWIEENIFYPACETIPKLVNIIDEGRADHQLVKAALEDLEEISEKTKRFNELLDKLIVGIEHHVYEEENIVFPTVRRVMTAPDFDRLTHEVMDSYYSPRSPRAADAH